MAFEPVAKELEVKFAKQLKEESIPVVMTVASNEVAISRVISISANPCVENVISNNASVQIDGKIYTKVLVEDVAGNYTNLENTMTFTIHSMNAEITPEVDVFSTAYLNSISSIQASEQAVTFTCNVSAKPILIAKEKFKYLEHISDLAEQKKDEVSYCDLIASTTQEFELNLELDLPSSVSKVLSVDSRAVLKSVEAGNDIVTLKGEIYSNMLYLTADEEPKLKNQKYIQEFNHELLANNIVISDLVNATLQVGSTDFELQGEINSAKGTIILKNQLKTNVFVRQNKTFSAIIDAFCPKYYLNNEFSSYMQQKVTSELLFEKIDGNVVLDEDSPRIDRVLAVCAGNIVLKSVDKVEGGINVVGVLTCNVIYKLDDELGTSQSVFTEVPFNLFIKRENQNDLDFVLNIVPKEIEARNKKSKEIDILAEISINIDTINNESGVILQNIVLGERRPINNSALGFYIVPQARDLWDISKALLVPGDVIMEQNPDLQFPFDTPQKIVIYRQKRL
ncbi:MAG: DUF3794 domain-containing protein [Clostridia bacterium]|nr:DUF3794 domain-containing protein [Clostridia bacterium]